MKNILELENEKISKLLFKYSIPAIIAMSINAVYNVVDRIFIGKFVGESALAALTVSFPIMMVIFAIAVMIGVGVSTLISIKLGEKNYHDASNVFGNGISYAMILVILSAILIIPNLESILEILGADDNVMNLGKTYLTIIISGFAFQMLGYLLTSTVRTEGKPVLSMAAMLAAGTANVIFDYIFIVRMGMGVKGAALATISGQGIGLLVVLYFYVSGQSQIRIFKNHFLPKLKLLKEIAVTGSASLFTMLGSSVSLLILNISLIKYGGMQSITAMGAIGSLHTLITMPLMGIQQGAMPIIGYNYGAKLRTRVDETLKLAILFAIIISTSVFIVLQIFPEFFIAMFIDKDSATMDIAVKGLRPFIFMLPLLSINILGVSYFQSTGQGKIASVLGLLRQTIALIPLLVILPIYFGLSGVWLSVPISDFIAISVSLACLIISRRNRAKEFQNKGL